MHEDINFYDGMHHSKSVQTKYQRKLLSGAGMRGINQSKCDFLLLFIFLSLLPTVGHILYVTPQHCFTAAAYFIRIFQLIPVISLMQMKHYLSMKFWWECCQRDTIMNCDKR